MISLGSRDFHVAHAVEWRMQRRHRFLMTLRTISHGVRTVSAKDLLLHKCSNVRHHNRLLHWSMLNGTVFRSFHRGGTGAVVGLLRERPLFPELL